ncbi:C40 family peptidase [Oscillochloris sp. ZM17-4]|uniref:C40 family peptidase n=1 Tax=Oscillochloris sp. ZM17-4 TaxID=2866714 RepID=UPI001C72CBED|nr:C40 family peptidase [Oscillochloris sp. ZM17-4]MBX0331164.1 C40 family peptidase [Oscillochloris sp. ZM17-4]
MRRAAIAILLLLLVAPLAAPVPAAAAPAAQGSSACEVAVNAALSVRGYPYVWGAKGPASFDCSGLTYWAYQQAGINIGVSTYDQQAAGVPIACTLADLHGSSSTCWQPGDLILLSYTGGQHVALYAGSGLFMDAYNPSTGVILHDVAADSFYQDHFWQARRPVECAGVSIDPGAPTALPPGSSPGIESIANILPPIALQLPWSCGACSTGQAQIATLEYPSFGPDPLYPFKWFGVWLWNEIFRSLICWLLAIAQALLNALSIAFNAVIVAGINLFWRLLVLFMLWFRDTFLALWGFVAWLRGLLWSWYGAVLDQVQQIAAIGLAVQALAQLASEAIAAVGEMVINLAQGIAYLVGLFMAIIPGMVVAIFSPTAPPQLAEIQTFFLFQWFIDFLRAFADSKLWWAWASFIAIVYLRFVLWLLDELSTLNQ